MELLGNFYRDGKLYTQKTIEVLDHDFPSYAEGKVIPHGIYDLVRTKRTSKLAPAEILPNLPVTVWRIGGKRKADKITQRLGNY